MKISFYVAREILFAFLVSFLFFFFIFFLNQILLLAEEILTKKAPLPEVLLLILFSLPAVIALAAPFASLLGVLLSIGRLSGDREILAAQASGISHVRLFVPAVILGLVFTMGSFFANDVLLPAGTLNFGKVYKKLLLSTPELELGSYSVKFYKNALIVTGAVQGRTVNGLIISDRTPQQDNRLLSAKKARLVEDNDKPGVLTLVLDDVVGIIPDARRFGYYEYFTAKGLEYNIVLQEIAPSLQNVGPREMSSFDLGRQIQEKDSQIKKTLRELKASTDVLRTELSGAYWTQQPYKGRPEAASQRAILAQRIQEMESRDLSDKVLQNWKTEFYQKFSIPLACVCFIFLAYPLANLQHRRGLTAVIGVGLFIAVLYWASLLAARTLSLEWGWLPEIALFLPNILILVGSFFIFQRLHR